MQALRDQIVEQQRAAGVRVIKPPHALAFLDPDLPGLKQISRQKPYHRWNIKSARLQGGANLETPLVDHTQVISGSAD